MGNEMVIWPDAPSTRLDVDRRLAQWVRLYAPARYAHCVPELAEMITAWTAAPLNTAWRGLVGQSHGTLRDHGSPPDARLAAWQRLAMLFGDTNAPELCLVVSSHAIELADKQLEIEPDPRVFATLRSHAKLAMLDLGLGRTKTSGEAIPIVEIGALVESNDDEVARWIKGFLGPRLDLRSGAEICWALAAIRAELVARPKPLTVNSARATLQA